MRSWKQLLTLLLALLLLTGCGGGDVRTAGRQIRPSEHYSEAVIADAMDVVEDYFKKHFDGCTLHTIVYDEEATGEKAEREQEKYGTDTIILRTDFWVDEQGGPAALNPGQAYRNYEWTLTRTLFGWKLQDQGYA